MEALSLTPVKAALASALRPGALSIHAHSWQIHYHCTKSKRPPTGNFQKDMLLSSTEIHRTSTNTAKAKVFNSCFNSTAKLYS